MFHSPIHESSTMEARVMATAGRPAKTLQMTDTERAELRRWLAVRTASADEKLRIRIVLGCADGVSGTRLAGGRAARAAIRRPVGAGLLEQNNEWSVQRARYMPHGTIAELLDHPVSPPSWQIDAAAQSRPIATSAGSYTAGLDTIGSQAEGSAC